MNQQDVMRKPDHIIDSVFDQGPAVAIKLEDETSSADMSCGEDDDMCAYKWGSPSAAAVGVAQITMSLMSYSRRCSGGLRINFDCLCADSSTVHALILHFFSMRLPRPLFDRASLGSGHNAVNICACLAETSKKNSDVITKQLTRTGGDKKIKC